MRVERILTKKENTEIEDKADLSLLQPLIENTGIRKVILYHFTGNSKPVWIYTSWSI